MEGIVGVPEIEPIEVGRIAGNAGSGIGANLVVDLLQLYVARLLGEAHIILVVAVAHIVNLQLTGGLEALAKQDGAVVGPT